MPNSKKFNAQNRSQKNQNLTKGSRSSVPFHLLYSSANDLFVAANLEVSIDEDWFEAPYLHNSYLPFYPWSEVCFLVVSGRPRTFITIF